jgi:predicted nucleic-acid-binding Zn-ribbon protein
MKNLGRALQAGIKGFAKAFEPARYQAVGVQVRCTHCKGEVFQEKEALLNTTGATLAGVDWLDQSGTALVCENCGLIQWYAMKPERLQA